MITTFASLCSGFGGADIGAINAGLKPIWGIEKVPEIAAVANHNLGGHVRVLDLLDADPTQFERPNVLHASPPCSNFSVAKAGRGETEDDIALARKVAEFIEVLHPQIFTLENVWQYRTSQSWKLILDTLYKMGYWVDVQHVNAANFGVPQTRKRMIVRARLNGWLPPLSRPERWVGWYEAIEDLIPTLPKSSLAPWQIKRLPEELRSYLIGNDRNGSDRVELNVSVKQNPAFTITANNGTKLKSFLLRPTDMRTMPIAEEDDPSFTVMAGGGKDWTPRAVLIPGENATSFSTRNADKPAATIGSVNRVGNLSRAVLIDEKLSTGKEERSLQLHTEEEPSSTVVAANSALRDARAILINTREGHQGGDLTAVSKGEPVYTLPATSGPARHKAWLEAGRVVKMTPRALARFQSIPDQYELPKSAALACKGIGNAVPPLLYQKIILPLREIIESEKGEK